MKNSSKSSDAARYEEWRGIPSRPTYQASSMGRIRSTVDKHGRKRILILKDWFAGKYKYISLGAKYKTSVHRLVCMAFQGKCPPGMECAHLDGNPVNNRSDNLAWVTKSENEHHKAKHGTNIRPVFRKDEHPMAKLNSEMVQEIRNKHESSTFLAKKYGVSPSTIRRVYRNEIWKTSAQ